MDTLCIDNLITQASIGIHGWEKKCLQKLIFDVQVVYINQFSINHPNTLCYLDYTMVSKTIVDIVNARHFFLIEEVAEVVSKTLIKNFSSISKVRIKVSKPGAIQNARNVSIILQRKKLSNVKKVKLYTG